MLFPANIDQASWCLSSLEQWPDRWQNSVMKAQLQLFIIYEQNNQARSVPIAKFVYNNAKNTNTGHIPFDLNYS